MSKNFLKLFFLIIVLSLFFCLNPFQNSYAVSELVMTSDLKKVGFTEAKLLTPLANGRFSGPNFYFSTNNEIISPTSDSSDIVMIAIFVSPHQLPESALFEYGNDVRDFEIPNSLAKIATIADKRTAINFIKDKHYVVIIGPQKDRIKDLALIMANKIR